jgi:hypothetical protein
MKTILATALGVAVTLSALALPVHKAVAATAELATCVDLNRIDHTHVVDDRNILFYLRGGNIYLNRLAHAAIGLERNRPFMYRTSIGRICANDLITVLEDWGFGFTPGASSALGKFELIDEARADSLRSGEPAGVEIEPVELEE